MNTDSNASHSSCGVLSEHLYDLWLCFLICIASLMLVFPFRLQSKSSIKWFMESDNNSQQSFSKGYLLLFGNAEWTTGHFRTLCILFMQFLWPVLPFPHLCTSEWYPVTLVQMKSRLLEFFPKAPASNQYHIICTGLGLAYVFRGISIPQSHTEASLHVFSHYGLISLQSESVLLLPRQPLFP